MPIAAPEATRRRVAPLSPDQRRAALVAATGALLRTHGPELSTRQIAQAAGVAEGTIFRVFPDKPSLIRAAITAELDPAPVLEALGMIDAGTPLRQRLTTATQILVRRLADTMGLLTTARALFAPPTGAGNRGQLRPERRRQRIGREAAELADSGLPAELEAAREKIMQAVARLIEPDAARLSRSPSTTARLLLAMVFAITVRGMAGAQEFTGAEIVSLLLDGLLARDQRPENLPHDLLPDDRKGFAC